MVSAKPRYWSVIAVALLGCSLATPLPSPQARAGQDVAVALSSALGAKAPATSFRVDVLDVPATEDGADNGVEGDEPTRQLSPTTQSFLSTLGTALGPIVGAIVGPLLTNIGQNLSAGSGAQAIAQLQQAAQAAVTAQQQQQAANQGNPAGAVASAAAAAAVEISGAGQANQAQATTTPSPSSPRPRPQTARPTRRPGARPPRPNGSNLRPTVDTTTVAPSAPPSQSFDAFVLDVPGKGPFLFLMTPNATAAEQSAAIKQAQQQAAHLLAVDGQSSPIGAVASLIGTTLRPQVTKPTSVGPLPVHPVVNVTPPPPLPNPLPSYHSLLHDDEQDQQGEEEVAVEGVESPDNLDEEHSSSGPGELKEDDSDFSSQSFLERLFPEMI